MFPVAPCILTTAYWSYCQLLIIYLLIMLSKALWKDRKGGAEQAKARAQYQKAREVERAKGQERLEKEKRRQQQAFQDAWNAKAEAEGNICKQNHTLAGTYLLAKSIARGGFLYSMLHVICMYMCMCLYMLYSSLHMLYVCLCTCMHAYYKAFRGEVARPTEERQAQRQWQEAPPRSR